MKYLTTQSFKLLTKLTKKWQWRLKLLKEKVFCVAHCQRGWRTRKPLRGNFAPARECLRNATHSDVEAALLMWFKNARAQSIAISGSILQKKAKDYATGLGIDDFNIVMGGFMESNVVMTYSSVWSVANHVTSQPNSSINGILSHSPQLLPDDILMLAKNQLCNRFLLCIIIKENVELNDEINRWFSSSCQKLGTQLFRVFIKQGYFHQISLMCWQLICKLR